MSGPVEKFAIDKVLDEISERSLFNFEQSISFSRFRDLLKLKNIGKKKYSELLKKYF